MSLYIVRIELDSNIYADFEILHNEMSAKGFKKTIVSNNGVAYHLPKAEYTISTLSDRSGVLKITEEAVIKTNKKAEILVTESKGVSWSGLSKVK